jgi:lipoprotein-anchoring transpeptidase ErfK/SrfK
MRSFVFALLALATVGTIAVHATEWSQPELVDELSMIEMEAPAINAACPPQAKYQIGLCARLLPTIQSEGGIKLQLDQGEVVCGLARFVYEDIRECARVYDHIAQVGQSWNMAERIRGQVPETFCINVLAEPVHSLAILSPRTERKCLGTKTAEDDKFDMEPAAPEGYTGNILEDPFNTDIYYINGCLCTCKDKSKDVSKPCCNCDKKAPAPKPFVAPPKKPVNPKPLPPKPLPTPSQCNKKSTFPYSFPYNQYTTKKDEVHVVADFELQRMRVYKGKKVLKEYKMSSSEIGIGEAAGSLRSPSGKFRISQLVGAKAKQGADFVNLKPNGKFSKKSDKSAIQTRVLVLDGEDANNKNTKSRLVYIHGTNKVDTLGQPASQGCFRLSNKDITDLFSRVKVGTRFFAIPKCAWRGPKGAKKKAKKIQRWSQAKKTCVKQPSGFDVCTRCRKNKAGLQECKECALDPKHRECRVCTTAKNGTKTCKPYVRRPCQKGKKGNKCRTRRAKREAARAAKRIADAKAGKLSFSEKLKLAAQKLKNKAVAKAKELGGKLKNKLKGWFNGKKPTPAAAASAIPKPAKTCATVPGFPYAQGINVVVDFALQRMRVYNGRALVKEYLTSTATKGVGFELGSEQSPSGHFTIAGKVGAGAASGADFVGLKLTGKSSTFSEPAAIQTRVLTLNGLDAKNKNTHHRQILIHGTNHAQQLGTPASKGCFRLSNEDVLDLFSRVNVGTKFTAKKTCAWPR